MNKEFLDKNGNELKGSARWLREISLDGGMEAHNKKVAMKVFSNFLDANPEVAYYISDIEANKNRAKLKVVK